MAKNSSNVLALGVGLNLDPLNQDIATAAKTAKEGMNVVAGAVVDGGQKAGAATERMADKVQSMRAQLRQATQDAQQMAEKYGVMSTQAIASASRAGELKDKIGDINTVITAFSADSKFTVVAGALQQAAGAASIVTGAMGLLGTKSKETEAMLLKVQSALALTQGLAQIKEMGASFTALRAVIVGQVIPSIAAMNTTMLLGIGGAIVALGAITVAVYKYTEGLDAERAAMERLNQAQINNIANRNKLKAIIDETLVMQNEALGNSLQQELTANDLAFAAAKKLLDDKFKALYNTGINTSKLLYQQVAQETALEDKFKKQAEEIRASYAKKEQDQIDIANKLKLTKQENQSKAALALTNKNYKELADLNKKLSTQDLLNAFKGPKDATAERDKNGLIAPQFIPITYQIRTNIDTQEAEFAIKQATENIKGRIANLIPMVKDAIVGIVGSALSGLGEAIAGALSGDEDPFEAFGVMLIKSLGQMAVQLGTELLAIGTAMLFVPALQASAAGYLLGGAALIVAGSAVSGLAGRKSGGSTQTAAATLTPTSDFNGNGSNYLGGNNSGNIVINGMIKGNDIQLVNGRNDRKFNRSLRFG
jgi:hypothetical protein